MAHGKGGYKRRQVIVSRLQYKLAAVNFLYLFAIILAVSMTVGAPLIGSLDDEFLGSALRDDAARRLLGLYDSTGIAVLVLVALCLFHSVLVSHRMVGPLYRFKQCFRELATGNLGVVVRIRRGDYLDPETEVMNEMIEQLSSKVRSIRESFACTNRTLPELARALEQEDRREAAVLCGKLGSELDDLGRKIRVFRVPSDGAVEGRAATPERVETTV